MNRGQFLTSCKRLKLQDGKSLVVSRAISQDPACGHWLVFLPGSSAELVSVKDHHIRALARPFKGRCHILVINKAGISLSGKINKRQFSLACDRSMRIRHVNEVMQKVIPPQHLICLAGHSEGAYIAPEIALRCARVSALLLLAGGTRGWIEEELRTMQPGELAVQASEIVKIYSGRTPERMWRGQSHRAWLSYDTDATLQALRRLRAPVLSLLGSQDELIDVASARSDLHSLASFKPKKLRYRILRGMDHHFNNDWDRLITHTQPFITRIFLGHSTSFERKK